MDFSDVVNVIKEELDKEDADFRRIGELLLLAVSLIREEIAFLFPEETPRQVKREKDKTEEEKEQEIKEEKSYSLDWLYSYKPQVGRPVGSTGTPVMSLREFVQSEIPLHKETDWQEVAREVREAILKGEFQVKSLRDFIGFLFAYMLYEDVAYST